MRGNTSERARTRARKKFAHTFNELNKIPKWMWMWTLCAALHNFILFVTVTVCECVHIKLCSAWVCLRFESTRLLLNVHINFQIWICVTLRSLPLSVCERALFEIEWVSCISVYLIFISVCRYISFCFHFISLLLEYDPNFSILYDVIFIIHKHP